MANTSSVTPWTLTMPAGSFEQYQFVFTIQGSGSPYPISLTSWEYVVRTTATDLSSPLIDITTTPSSEGAIAVTSNATLSQIVLTLNPAATVNLAPGNYAHSLWMQPSTASQFTWVTGELIIEGNPQP